MTNTATPQTSLTAGFFSPKNKDLIMTVDANKQIHPRLVDVTETIYRTGLGKTKLYELIKTGELRPIKLGRKTVFSEQEVSVWIEKQITNREVQ